MVGGNGRNQFRQYAGQNNVRNQNGLIIVSRITNQIPNGNGNVVAARVEGNVTRNNGNQIRCYNYRGLGHFSRNCTVKPRRRDAAYLQTQLLIAQKKETGIQLQAEEFNLIAAAADLDEIEEVNTNCILMANLQQASTLGTQTDKAPVHDSYESAEVHNYDNSYDNEIFSMFTQEEQYTKLLEPIPEPHQVLQNDSNVIFKVSSVEQDGRIVDQHPAVTKIDETHALLKPVTSNLIPTPQESKVVKNDKVIAPGMFRINPFKPSTKENYVPNKVRASVRINPITVSQPHVITKKDVNFDSNGLSSTGVDNTAKTRRPQPRSNTKNDRVTSAFKSSCSKNKEVEVEEHPRNLPLFKNKKHMSSECNNVKLAIRNDKSKVVCAMCNQYLITTNHDVCVLNYVNDVISRGTVRFGNDHIAVIMGFSELQWGNILITRVYFVEGLGHNQFLVGQFCNSNLEVAFRRNTCFVINIEGVDLLKGNHTTNLYTINLHEMASASLICLMACATYTMAWLWHQRLSHLNVDTINDLAKNDLVTGLSKLKYHKEHLCPLCEQRKSKRVSHPPKPVLNSKQRALYYPKNDREDIGKLGEKGELDFLFEDIYDDYIGGQPLVAPRSVLAAQAPSGCQTLTASTTIANTALAPASSSSQVTNFPNTSQDVDELETKQHV
nr:retrovirus-related Pol polyprotein from transposon TNT 1-94 [Tanacetum cinerariifolium]